MRTTKCSSLVFQLPRSFNIPSTYVLILPVSSDPVSVVKALDNFRSKNVIAVRDPEARTLVEGRLVRWELSRVPRERLWADACEGLGVGVLAGVDKGKTKVGVLLLLEDHAAQEEHSTVEAGQMLGFVDRTWTVVDGAEGEVGAGAGVAEEVGDGAVGGCLPAGAVVGVALWVVHVRVLAVSRLGEFLLCGVDSTYTSSRDTHKRYRCRKSTLRTDR